MENQKYTYFVLLNPKKTKFSFSAYSDQDGQVQFLWNRIDYKSKEPLKRRFEFSKSYRTIRVPLAQRMKNPDGELVSVADFLRQHPECAKSPNAELGPDGRAIYKPLFKELNESEDARIAVEARARKVKAENAALTLEGAQLEAIAAAAGYRAGANGWNDNLAIHRCLELAAQDPAGFLAMLEDDTYEMKAFLAEAVRNRVVTKNGDIYMWGKILIGGTLDEAVAQLSDDVQLYRGIKMKLGKLGIAASEETADSIIEAAKVEEVVAKDKVVLEAEKKAAVLNKVKAKQAK